MFAESGDWYRGNDDDPHVTYMVVRDRLPDPDPDGPDRPGEEDAIGAAALALQHMLSMCGTDERVMRRVRTWCSARIRKVVKRAHGAKWDKMVRLALGDDGSHEGAVVMDPERALPGAVLVRDFGPTMASVLVVAPMRASDQPPALRRLQVSGLELDKTIWKVPVAGCRLRIMLDDGVRMSTGQAIAQAGHATQIAFRELPDDRYAEWAEAGFPIDASWGDVEGACMATPPDVVITDAGFTEVRPGTRTCAAWLAERPVPVVSIG
jgi:peptidyl-tRNA hydrolase